MKSFKDFLNEMPHLEINGKFIDLEAEKGVLIDRLLKLLLGKKVRDKYGNEIVLKTKQDILKLIELIKTDKILRNFIQKELNK